MDSRRWETIQASFDDLVELDVNERAGRLAVLATMDPELRRALASLLAADAEAGARLAPLEAGFVSQPDTALDPLGLAGRTISHFEVRELLGVGGMGAVYRAEDTRLGRAVALKFLLPPYNLDAAAKARFLREAHSAAALDHPNLCSIHEVGTSEDGRLFLAMSLCPGETLKTRLGRDGPLHVGQALEIARQVAEGLKAAHATGIVHRDLKPANIMLLPDGAVKILDFGLAKARDQSLSETGARFGTVSYMAPEQIRGAAVDSRTDLWALGVVLYEMLTGGKPFGGEEEVAIAHAILHDEPVLPSTHRGDVSAAVEDLVLRLLQKDPARRYTAAADVLADLARVGTVAAGARHAQRRRLRRVRRMLSSTRGRTLAAGAALLLLGAVGYAGVTGKNGASGAIAPRSGIAVLPFQNLSAEGPHAYFAGGLHGEILTQLSKVAALKVVNRASVMEYAGPNPPPLQRVARELGVGSIVLGSVQVVGDRMRLHVQLVDPATGAHIWADRYDRTLDDAFAIQSNIAQQIVAAVGVSLTGAEELRLARAPTANAEAYQLYLQGREYATRPGLVLHNYEIARQLLERAVAFDPAFALAHAELSEVYGWLHWLRFDSIPPLAARQLAEAEAALRLAPDLPQAHVAMGAAHYRRRGDYRRALDEYAIALQGLPNDAGLWSRIAGVHRRSGNWDAAVAAFEKAAQLNPRDEDLLGDLGAGTLLHMRRYAEAVHLYDRALALAPDLHVYAVMKGWTYALWNGRLDTLRAVLRAVPPDADLSWLGSGIAQRAQLLYWERQADSLLHLHTTAQGAAFEAADVLPTLLYAAWAHQFRGDATGARAAFDSARVVLDSVMTERPDDWRVHASRGLALAGLGRRENALREARWLEQRLANRPDALFGHILSEGRARILAQVGEADPALDELERILERPARFSVHSVRLEAFWDPIREHPRFKALLAKYEQVH